MRNPTSRIINVKKIPKKINPIFIRVSLIVLATNIRLSSA